MLRTLLFDIDGTLLLSPGTGREALAGAVEREFGVDQADADLDFGGRTDRDLVKQLLLRNRLDPTDENQGRVRRAYALELRQRLTKEGGRVMPGVFDLLLELSRVPHLALAVMTGNFPETARMKLETFELINFFPWVIGGDLDVDRDDLARRAAQHVVRNSGKEAANNLIVIGDTQNDVRCAKAINARCLAVCTGAGSRDQLESAAPELLVDDLLDPSVLPFLTESVVS